MQELTFACKAIFRNKTSAILVAVQLAITVTVVVNEYTGIMYELANTARESGMPSEGDLFTIRSTGFADDFNISASIEEDLLLIRNTEGVVGAYATNSSPMSGNTWRSTIRTSTGEDAVATSPAWYMVDQTGLDTLGVKLLYGDNFVPTDIVPENTSPAKLIITQEVANLLYPETELAEVVGKVVYSGGDDPLTIIGILDQLHGPSGNATIAYQVMLQPMVPQRPQLSYFVRTEPSRRDDVMKTIEKNLAESNPDRIVGTPTTFEEYREEAFRGNVVLLWVLTVTMVVLLIITSCGIVGLVSFNIQRQTKHIGTRRALGARISDIVMYYYTQYGLICLTGLLIGIAITVPLNIFLVDQFQFPKMEMSHLAVGVALTFGVTMIGVAAPTLRASKIEPSIALRTE